MSEQKTLLMVIAGPMGAGKTTFYDAHLKEAFPILIPPISHLREATLHERRSFAVEDLVADTEFTGEREERRLRHESNFHLYRRSQSECRAHLDPNESRRAIGSTERYSRIVRRIDEEPPGSPQARRRSSCL